MPAVASTPAPEPTAPPPLPEGWKQAEHPDGRTYYFVKGTKHTQWKRPTEPAEPGVVPTKAPPNDSSVSADDAAAAAKATAAAPAAPQASAPASATASGATAAVSPPADDVPPGVHLPDTRIAHPPGAPPAPQGPVPVPPTLHPPHPFQATRPPPPYHPMQHAPLPRPAYAPSYAQHPLVPPGPPPGPPQGVPAPVPAAAPTMQPAAPAPPPRVAQLPKAERPAMMPASLRVHREQVPKPRSAAHLSMPSQPHGAASTTGKEQCVMSASTPSVPGLSGIAADSSTTTSQPPLNLPKTAGSSTSSTSYDDFMASMSGLL